MEGFFEGLDIRIKTDYQQVQKISDPIVSLSIGGIRNQRHIQVFPKQVQVCPTTPSNKVAGDNSVALGTAGCCFE